LIFLLLHISRDIAMFRCFRRDISAPNIFTPPPLIYRYSLLMLHAMALPFEGARRQRV